jgi:hypothetical protein
MFYSKKLHKPAIEERTDDSSHTIRFVIEAIVIALAGEVVCSSFTVEQKFLKSRRYHKDPAYAKTRMHAKHGIATAREYA